MIGLDTSVALRLLTGAPTEQAEQARGLVASANEPVAVSDLVVSEVYFALRHHYAVPHADSIRALHSLLGDARVRATGVARAVIGAELSRPALRKVGLMDQLILADCAREHCELATFDRALAKLPGARHVVDFAAS